MKTCSIEDQSGRHCQTCSSIRTRRSHELGGSGFLPIPLIRLWSCRKFYWTRSIPSVAPICSALPARGRASIPSGWRAASCNTCARHSIAGDDSASAGSLSTCHWSGVRPKRRSFSSVPGDLHTTLPNRGTLTNGYFIMTAKGLHSARLPLNDRQALTAAVAEIFR